MGTLKKKRKGNNMTTELIETIILAVIFISLFAVQLIHMKWLRKHSNYIEKLFQATMDRILEIAKAERKVYELTIEMQALKFEIKNLQCKRSNIVKSKEKE